MILIDNDPFDLARQVTEWVESREVVLEATYGWYRGGGGRHCRRWRHGASGAPVGNQGVRLSAG